MTYPRVASFKTADAFEAGTRRQSDAMRQLLDGGTPIPLEQGMHDGSVLTCLEHMWQFDLRTGAPLGDALEGLRGYPLKEEAGLLYVAL